MLTSLDIQNMSDEERARHLAEFDAALAASNERMRLRSLALEEKLRRLEALVERRRAWADKLEHAIQELRAEKLEMARRRGIGFGAMTRRERDAVRAAFNFQCAYCGVSETSTGSELTVDHFRPTIHNGSDEADNWVYSCFSCNIFKGAYWSDDDNLALIHPLRDDLSLHLREENGLLIGLTDRGRLQIEQIHLNRPTLVAYRLYQARIRWLETSVEATQKLSQQEKERGSQLEDELSNLL